MTDDQETEALLEEQLKLIGGFLEEDEQPAEEQGVVRPFDAVARRRRVRALLLTGTGLAASAALLLTLLWAPWDPAPAETARLSESGIVACSELIVEGTVSSVRSDELGRLRVRLRVDRYLKPESGPEESEFLVSREDSRAYKMGERVLVSVSRFENEEPLLFVGEEIEPTWEWMRAESVKAVRPACPGRG